MNKTVQFEKFTIQWPKGVRKKMVVVGWQIYSNWLASQFQGLGGSLF